MGQYIETHLRKKWDDWKRDWFYTALPDHLRLRLPTGPPERSAGWLAVSELGEEYDTVLDRLRGLRSRGLTATMVFGDYFRCRIVPLQERSRGAWAYTGYKRPDAHPCGPMLGLGRLRRAGGGSSGAEPGHRRADADPGRDPSPLQRPRPGEYPSRDDGGWHRRRSVPQGCR